MPEVATAQSALKARMAPAAISLTVSRLTDPCCSRVSGRTPSRLVFCFVGVGHDAAFEVFGATRDRGDEGCYAAPGAALGGGERQFFGFEGFAQFFFEWGFHIFFLTICRGVVAVFCLGRRHRERGYS